MERASQEWEPMAGEVLTMWRDAGELVDGGVKRRV